MNSESKIMYNLYLDQLYLWMLRVTYNMLKYAPNKYYFANCEYEI